TAHRILLDRGAIFPGSYRSLGIGITIDPSKDAIMNWLGGSYWMNEVFAALMGLA
ncbi:hypothetical protein KI387_023609, partial [Taxus chinensis]